MKQEKVHQGLREGELVLMATAKLREQVIERARRLVDGAEYVPISDFLREIEVIKGMLCRLRSRGRQYAVGLPAEVAQSVMLALLLIPDAQAELASAGKSSLADAFSSSPPVEELAKASDGARRVAEKLWGSRESAPTIEAWQHELTKLGSLGSLAEQLLTTARTQDGKPIDASGRPLANVPPAPKALPSAFAQEVEVDVRTVDEDPGVAMVKVRGAAEPDGAAMKGMFERRLRLRFDEESHPGIAKFLALAQATDVRVRARVNVQRGLGSSNAKHDELRLSEVIDETGSRRQMSLRLLELHVVTGDLFAIEGRPQPT